MRGWGALGVILLLLAPLFLHAQVILSEIMYDLEGSDSDREWIEIYNEGASAVDLTGWRFFEGDTNHKLSVSSGNILLTPGSYAIIADDAATFASEYPHFNGTLFDSSFSLHNKGEVLTLRDSDLIDVDSVTYSSDWGAAGDGSALAFDGTTWSAKSPTPGSGPFVVHGGSEDGADDTGSNETSEAPATLLGGDEDENKSSFKKAEKREFIVVEAGRDRVVTVGAAEFFEAKGYKKDGTEHPYVSYRWNFGNGVVREGKKVLHQYNYPGTYVVWVSGVTVDKLSATDRIVVKAQSADILVSKVTPEALTLTNNTNRELDLSLWSVRDNERVFMLPQNTIILAGASITLQNTITGLDTTLPDRIALLYPNGHIASAYGDTPIKQSSPVAALPILKENMEQKPAPQEGREDDMLLHGGLSNEQLIASVGTQNDNGALYPWLFGLLLVIGGAIIALLMTSPHTSTVARHDSQKPVEQRANEFTIVEDQSGTRSS